MVVLVTPPALEHISWRFYVMFGIFNALMGIVLHFFFVETKGKSLEEIDKYFAERYHGGAELRATIEEVEHRHQADGDKSIGLKTHVEEVSVSDEASELK